MVLLPIGGLHAIYHLLREPKATIDLRDSSFVKTGGQFESFESLLLLKSTLYPEILRQSQKKLQHSPDIAHQFSNPPATPTMKGFPAYSLLLKVARFFLQFGVLKETSPNSSSPPAILPSLNPLLGQSASHMHGLCQPLGSKFRAQ